MSRSTLGSRLVSIQPAGSDPSCMQWTKLSDAAGSLDSASGTMLSLPGRWTYSKLNSDRALIHQPALPSGILLASSQHSAAWSVYTVVSYPKMYGRYVLAAHTTARASSSVTL